MVPPSDCWNIVLQELFLFRFATLTLWPLYKQKYNLLTSPISLMSVLGCGNNLQGGLFCSLAQLAILFFCILHFCPETISSKLSKVLLTKVLRCRLLHDILLSPLQTWVWKKCTLKNSSNRVDLSSAYYVLIYTHCCELMISVCSHGSQWVRSWWSQLVVMAACQCYPWWRRLWSDTLWATDTKVMDLWWPHSIVMSPWRVSVDVEISFYNFVDIMLLSSAFFCSPQTWLWNLCILQNRFC
jgi:hypothetical protein